VFPLAGDPWPTIGAWAQRHKFYPREPQTGDTKLFQKGTGLLTAPMRAQFTIAGGQMQVQAWLPISLFVRVTTFFILPAEMPINSGGFRASLPRSIARKAINELLGELRAPLIS